MNGMNFFAWLRDGVRRSVLLGVGDAIEQLGTPDSGDDAHPSVAGLLQMHAKEGPATASLTAPNKRRKRLGKSLKDIETPS